MLVIENTDLLQGDATNASEVDFTVFGLDNNALKLLASGQLANSKGTLYTSNSTDVISTIILVNTGAAHNHVNLYVAPAAGTSRRLIAKDLQLEPGYSLHFDGKSVMILDTAGGVVTGLNVSDVAYGASWDTVVGIAPSKNAVYDQMELRAPKANPVFTGTLEAPAVKITTGAGANKVFTSDADGDGTWAISGGLSWSLVTGATNAAKNNGYACNTSGGAFTLTLPATPSVGDIVAVCDGASTFSTYNLTIGRNSENIMGLAEDMTVSVNNIAFALVYASAALGWRIST
jgi:hypothetical protein